MRITFGRDSNQEYHTLLWVKAAGLDPELVVEAIRVDMLRLHAVLPKEGLIKGDLYLSAQQVRYNAYRFEDGSVNVGRITIERR